MSHSILQGAILFFLTKTNFVEKYAQYPVLLMLVIMIHSVALLWHNEQYTENRNGRITGKEGGYILLCSKCTRLLIKSRQAHQYLIHPILNVGPVITNQGQILSLLVYSLAEIADPGEMRLAMLERENRNLQEPISLCISSGVRPHPSFSFPWQRESLFLSCSKIERC